MRISLATNFDDALPHLVQRYGVFELYGKLPADVVGGGRATFMLAPTSRRALQKHVESPLSIKLLSGEFSSDDTVLVDVEEQDGEQVLVFQQPDGLEAVITEETIDA